MLTDVGIKRIGHREKIGATIAAGARSHMSATLTGASAAGAVTAALAYRPGGGPSTALVRGATGVLTSEESAAPVGSIVEGGLSLVVSHVPEAWREVPRPDPEQEAVAPPSLPYRYYHMNADRAALIPNDVRRTR